MFVYKSSTYHPCLPDARLVLPPRVLADYAACYEGADPEAPCRAMMLPGGEWAIQFVQVLVSPVPLRWLDHVEVTR